MSSATKREPEMLVSLANRIRNVDHYGTQDADETIESICERLVHDPLDIIRDLLDQIENVQ